MYLRNSKAGMRWNDSRTWGHLVKIGLWKLLIRTLVLNTGVTHWPIGFLYLLYGDKTVVTDRRKPSLETGKADLWSEPSNQPLLKLSFGIVWKRQIKFFLIHARTKEPRKKTKNYYTFSLKLLTFCITFWYLQVRVFGLL